MKDLLNDENEIYRLIMLSDPWEKNQWEVLNYKENDIICKHHEAYPYFYVLIEGELNIYHTSEKGKTYSQSVYKSGNYFGELEIFDKMPYICEIKALSRVKLIRLPKSIFEKWIEADNAITLYLLKSLCCSSYKLSKKAIEDTLYSLKFRICDYLILKYKESLLDLNDFSISKTLLSERFVVTKRSINRILKELSDENYILVDKGTIKILNLSAIEKQREKERF